MPGKRTESDLIIRIVWIAGFCLVLGTCLAIRVRLLDLPLERDEGEYAYAGQLMLGGVPPYKLAYNMKFPGTYAAYAAIMAVFGQTATGIHAGFLLVNLATTVVIVLLGCQLLGFEGGLAAGTSYSILSLNPSVLGFSAHATHFVILPALVGIFLLVRRRQGVVPFIAGCLGGISLLMKQPGAFFCLFGAFYLLYRCLNERAGWRQFAWPLSMYCLGVAVPFLLTCIVLRSAGTFDAFWFWTIKYAADYGSVVPLSLGAQVFTRNWGRVVDHLWPLWLIAVIGLIGLFFFKRLRDRAIFIAGFGFFSAAALSAGLYFRPHYFVLVLPFIAFGVGEAVLLVRTVWPLKRWPNMVLALAIVVACLILPVFGKRFFFLASASEVSRSLYGANPFPEAQKVAEFIRSRTNAEDTIAVLGSEPEIYFYAGRRSATGYIYMYPAMEPHPLALQMQRQLIDEIEAARPRMIVVTGIDMSWKWPVAGSLLQSWAERFVAEHYRPIGLVNIISRQTTDYYLPLKGISAPVGENYLLICERR